jgi:osmotically-inducible protein OsmY
MQIQKFLVSALCLFLMYGPTSGFSQITPNAVSTPGSQQPATPQVQPPGPANSDVIISDKVQEALVKAAPKEGSGVNVNVEVKNSIVTLTGVVADKQAKEKVGHIVRNVPGVKGVINKLETNN